MTIFLAILIEIATVVGSSVLALKGTTDAILQIPENGYKLDMEVLKKYHEEHLQNSSKNKNILSKVMLFTPGVNLLVIAINTYKFKRKIMNDEEIRKVIIPMTDEEKGEYAKIDNYFEKIVFTVDNTKYNTSKSGIEVGTAAIYHEALPETYTLEEVKRLNAVTGDTYRLGIIDEVPTAIIGIPGEDRPVNTIKFKVEDYKVSHKYVHISEWQALDKSFIVYPFFNHYPEELDNCVKQIKEEKQEESSTQIVSDFPVVNADTQIDYEIEDTSIGDESGPTLVKKGPYSRR